MILSREYDEKFSLLVFRVRSWRYRWLWRVGQVTKHLKRDSYVPQESHWSVSPLARGYPVLGRDLSLGDWEKIPALVKLCPTGALRWSSEQKTLALHQGKCFRCGLCVEASEQNLLVNSEKLVSPLKLGDQRWENLTFSPPFLT